MFKQEGFQESHENTDAITYRAIDDPAPAQEDEVRVDRTGALWACRRTHYSEEARQSIEKLEGPEFWEKRLQQISDEAEIRAQENFNGTKTEAPKSGTPHLEWFLLT